MEFKSIDLSINLLEQNKKIKTLTPQSGPNETENIGSLNLFLHQLKEKSFMAISLRWPDPLQTLIS